MHGHYRHEHRHHGNPEDLQAYIARLDDPSRDEWQKPSEVIRALGLRPGQTVADIGSGTGYLSFQLARAVGRTGRVFAVDVEPRLLGVLGQRVAERKVRQITPVLGLPDDPLLPEACCDRVVLVNAYHHLPHRGRALRRLALLLRRGGRLALIDFHHRELPVGPPVEETVARASVLREVARAGLKVADELTFLPYQYFLLLRA